MELRQLQTFVTITQTESFSRAAEILGYTQSALTVQIRLLENELGVKLFDRMGKKVYLTAAGSPQEADVKIRVVCSVVSSNL